MMDQSIKFDLALINRYDRAGPRYTSYPTALELHAGFGDADYRRQIAKSNAAGGPLSLYFHIPFCDTVCFYCACNKIVTKRHERSVDYLGYLKKEVELYIDKLGQGQAISQLHLGGGSPTFFRDEELSELMSLLRAVGYDVFRIVLSGDQRQLKGIKFINIFPSDIYCPGNAHQCDYVFLPQEHSAAIRDKLTDMSTD